MQRQADPDSYDRQEMLELCLDLLGNYLRPRNGDAGPPRPNARKSISTNGSSAGNPARARMTGATRPNEDLDERQRDKR